MEILKIQHNTPEWFAFRQTGIGGSDASAILGLNPYKTNVELWEEKTGLRPPKPVSNIEAVDYGQKAEEPLRQLFAFKFPQYEVISTKSVIYRIEGFMFASLDGELREKTTGRVGVLEIKTSNIFQSMANERWNNRVPDNYYCQLCHSVHVRNAAFAVLYAELQSEQNGLPYSGLRPYVYERTDMQDDIDYLAQEERKFWTSVETRRRPSLILPRI